jgi:TRAP-type uncharacterized transport system fused permease subunit
MRLGIAAYVVPFVFALHPALILRGTIGDILVAVVASSIGTFLLAVSCAGYLFRLLNWTKRALFCLSGLLLMLPTWQGAWLIADIAGLALGAALMLWEWKHRSAFKSILRPLDTYQG